jgi:hypothetical protein
MLEQAPRTDTCNDQRKGDEKARPGFQRFVRGVGDVTLLFQRSRPFTKNETSSCGPQIFTALAVEGDKEQSETKLRICA